MMPAVNLHPATGLNSSTSSGSSAGGHHNNNHNSHNNKNGISISIAATHRHNKLLKVCAWCEDSDPKLRYILTHESVRKAFCSESCMIQFRDKYSKVRIAAVAHFVQLFDLHQQAACCNCGRSIQGLPVAGDEDIGRSEARKEFCCTECKQKYRLKHIEAQKHIQFTKHLNELHQKSIARSPDQISANNNNQSPPVSCRTHSSATRMDSGSEHSTSSSATIVSTPDRKEKQTAGKSGGHRSKAAAPSFHYETYSIFDWDSYLEEVGGTPAPDRCFKQSQVPPENEFMTGMKLEARDPRNPSSTTIASVVYPFGSRLQLRLEGSDNANDFFELVDSASIQPIGTCDRNGEMLQPPLGFRRNPSQWPNFMISALQNALIAPKSAFRPEPPDPADNYFEVGHEAGGSGPEEPPSHLPRDSGSA